MDNTKRKLRLSTPCHLLATGFGSGLSPYMPGTLGSLVAIPFGCLFAHYLSMPFFLLTIFISTVIGIYFCGRTARDIGVADHGSIVWDEFVGMWIAMLFLPLLNWQWIAVAFLLFRLFDIWKPWPICWFDQHVHGGLGIMLDDLLAGAIVAAIIFVIGY